MEDWEARHKDSGTKPSDQAIKNAYKDLGGAFGTPQALWHPKADRKNCKRFSKQESA